MILRHIPNALSLLRIALVYPVAYLILEGRYAEVMLLFGVSALTDALDGYLAKRYGWATALGRHLDPLADKLLLVTVFICLSMAGMVPWWLTLLVFLRDLVIGLGALVYKIVFGPLNGHPTVPSKLNTLFQIVYCLAVVARAAYGLPPSPVITTLGALVLATTFVSGLDYTLIYIRRAAAATRSATTTH
jgi:cardiolipin synthase (CMP-forming)